MNEIKTSNRMTVGYIGLGIMGLPMASNLLSAGFDLVVWNRTAEKARSLVEKGAKLAASPAQVAGQVDVVCLNVTDTPDVEAVLFGEGGVVEADKPGLIVVDHSTISPIATKAFAKRLAKEEMTLVDAPVSGGDTGAKAGTLSVMVGGDAQAVANCMPIFEVVGGKVTHLGEVGTGQACKACNQIAVSCNLMGVCEAMALARRTGLDLGKMIEVVANGAGGSWQLANLGPKIAAGDHQPGFMIDLVLKDLAIVADTAADKNLPLSATSLAEAYFRAVAAGGGGKLGTQAMAQTLERLGHFKFADDD